MFARHDDAIGDTAIVVVSRGDSTASLEVPLPTAWTGLTEHDAWARHGSGRA